MNKILLFIKHHVCFPCYLQKLIKSRPYLFQRVKIILYITLLLVTLFLTTIYAMLDLVFSTGRNMRLIFQGIWIILQYISLVLLIVPNRRRFSKSVMMYSLSGLYYSIAVFFFQEVKGIRNIYIIKDYIFFPFLVCLFVDDYWIAKSVLIFASIVYYMVAFVLDLIFLYPVVIPENIRVNIIQRFVDYFAFLIIIHYFTYSVKASLIKEMSRILRIIKNLANKNFDDEECKKLIKKKDIYLNDTMVGVKKILINMRILERYLIINGDLVKDDSDFRNSGNSNKECSTSSNSSSNSKSTSSDTSNNSNDSNSSDISSTGSDISSSDYSDGFDSSSSSSGDESNEKKVKILFGAENDQNYFKMFDLVLVYFNCKNADVENMLNKSKSKNPHTSYFKKIESVVNCFKGEIGFMDGFEVMCFWNHQLAFCEENAVSAVIKIKTELMKCFGIKVYCSVSCDIFHSFRLGANMFKRISFLGKNVETLKLLNQLAQKTGHQILLHQNIQKSIKFSYLTTPIHLCSDGDYSELFLVYDVVKKEKSKQDEWNYEIGNYLNSKDSFGESWQCYIDGDMKKLLSLGPIESVEFSHYMKLVNGRNNLIFFFDLLSMDYKGVKRDLIERSKSQPDDKCLVGNCLL